MQSASSGPSRNGYEPVPTSGPEPSEGGGESSHLSHEIDETSTIQPDTGRDSLKLLLLTFISVIFVIWPWILFGVCWRLGGIPLKNSIVKKYPQESAFFVTSIAVVIYLAIIYLFQNAVTILVKFTPTLTHDIVFFIAFKKRTFSPRLYEERKFGRLLILVVVFVGFTFVTSGITALLLPIKYPRSTSLKGTELDFASNNTDCINWIDNNGISFECGWRTFKDLRYNDCLNDNRMLDAIQAGNSNALSTLVNYTSSTAYAYSRLSEVGGLYFLGSTRGVLPNGPNGIPVFNTLSNSSFSSWLSDASVGSAYNYTLELQGVSNNVTCAYTPYANVTYIGTYDWTVSGICQQPAETFLMPPAYSVSPSNRTLGFWACRRSPTGQSYDLFLRGTNLYETNIGNVTCTISSIQVISTVTYSSQLGAFTSQEHTPTSLNISKLMDTAVQGVGDIVWKAQSRETNLVGDMMVGLAGESLKLPTDAGGAMYLRLFEAVIQGMLDYEVTSTRLIYSARPPPASCLRTFNGSAYFNEFGLHVTRKTAAFLVPMTLINATSLAMLFVALFWKTGNRNVYMDHEELYLYVFGNANQPGP